MAPALAPRLLGLAIAGTVVAMGAAITVVLQRITSDPPPTAPRLRPPVLELVGNHTFTSAQVRAAIAAEESPFVDEDGALDRIAVEREALLVSAFYWNHGYANVKVGAAHYDRDRAVIAIPVDEGPRFTILDVKITGDVLGSEASHLAMIRVRRGMVFSRQMIATDIQALTTFYADHSYAYATVVPQTTIDVDARTIGLTVEIVRGQPMTVERIDVVAKTPAGEATVRSALAVAPGEPFNETRLVESKRRALALGRFRDIAISTKRGSHDTLIVVTFEELD